MLAFPKYESYRNSGVELLGEIPEQWEVIKLKRIFTIFSGYAFKSQNFIKEKSTHPLLVTPGSFNPDGGLYFNEKNSIYYTRKYPKEYLLSLGDQVIVMTDLSYKKLILGRCEFVPREGLLLNQRIGKILASTKYNK